MKFDADLILTDGDIILRPFTAEDVEAHYKVIHGSINELKPWFGWCTDGYTIEDTRGYVSSRLSDWEHDIEYSFAIENNARKIIGGCGVNHIDKACRTAWVGYWVQTSQTGKGIATAAAKLLCRWAFEELKMNRIEMLVATANAASIRVAEKLGGVQEGLLRKRIVVRDELQDAILFGILNPKLT